MMVKETWDESMKGWFCMDEHKQHGTMGKDDVTSPMVVLDSVFITTAIDAAKGREVSVVNLPGAYLNVDTEKEEEVCMVLWGPLSNLSWL